MTSIEIHHLSKCFDDVVAIEDLSFTARPGAVTGFLGPNGAGKTTTLKTLLGLLAPSAGSATFDGCAYAELAEPYRHVGAVLESTGFHPGRRAGAHLRVLATAAGLPPSRVDEVLDEVGLADAADRRIKGFSLGMRQRLALAAALLGDPDVLILDEPANGLDPEGVHWLRCFVRSFADRGGTVLASSHPLAEVAQTVDDVVIIAHGRLVTQSSLTELAERRPSEVRVRTPQAETLRSALSGHGIAADLLGPDTLVAFDTTAEAVGLAAAGVGAAIYEMTTQHLDLEEMFLELTNHEEAIR
jgi:ABC-2 type transport system ATP-binding protein